jgi:hypothetical protein
MGFTPLRLIRMLKVVQQFRYLRRIRLFYLSIVRYLCCSSAPRKILGQLIYWSRMTPPVHSRMILTALAMLLAVQLTGLSCLEGWQAALSTGSSTIAQQVSFVTPGGGMAGDNGCPCHFSFVSIPSSALQVSYPISLAAIVSPPSCALAHPSVPFHPPLTL